MKTTFFKILIASFFFSPLLYGSDNKDEIELSKSEGVVCEGDVLEAIDSICGDTWCEGSEFSFEKVSCSRTSDSCTVAFTMDDAQYTCEIRGYSHFDYTLNPSRELDNRFYEQMTKCIWGFQ